jgi:hypothetical protein
MYRYESELFRGGPVIAITWSAMPPTRISPTASFRVTFRSSHAAQPNAIHAPATGASGTSRAGSSPGCAISRIMLPKTSSNEMIAATRSFALMRRGCHHAARSG